MKVVDPIRDKVWQAEFEDYFQSTSQRNYIMYLCGVYMGLRISDILPLRVQDIKGTHLVLQEQKTGNNRRIIIHHKLRKALDEYTADMKSTQLLFPSRKRNRRNKIVPLKRKGAIDVLKKAAAEVGYTDPIGTHSLRKTFAYNYHEKYKDLVGLQRLLGHKHQQDTIRYLGLEQDMFDERIASM